MEHSTGTTTRTDRHAERQARNDWLITELSRLAAETHDPAEKARYRRTADSLVRLAIAMRS
ncbi:hypothetical protein GCM10009630_03800 [Kribbella jejuensis]|uniref:Uncharacterized protein n=1 Tax=Kribbella jejuensis TaxID=236068 RepID=A0A542EU63_9ACTN|nr:hypothetical protein [Kribbella jejuensis]TQJ18913.1 hypothetical protein FB475_3067 [Kribbella jejuensis]